MDDILEELDGWIAEVQALKWGTEPWARSGTQWVVGTLTRARAEIAALRKQCEINYIKDRLTHRNEALEEAARALEQCQLYVSPHIIIAIRALKDEADE